MNVFFIHTPLKFLGVCASTCAGGDASFLEAHAATHQWLTFMVRLYVHRISAVLMLITRTEQKKLLITICSGAYEAKFTILAF